MDLDAVLERRRQDAICNGNMIDLAADVDDEQLQRCYSLDLNIQPRYHTACMGRLTCGECGQPSVCKHTWWVFARKGPGHAEG